MQNNGIFYNGHTYDSIDAIQDDSTLAEDEKEVLIEAYHKNLEINQ